MTGRVEPAAAEAEPTGDGASIRDARLDGMTIEGISVTEMLAYWRAGHAAQAEAKAQ
jgi:hypothetical protein